MLCRLHLRASRPRAATQSAKRFFSTSGDQVLVLADHNNKTLAESTLHSVSAASKLNPGRVTLLVAGNKCEAVAKQAAKIKGVSQVLLAEDAAYENCLGENVTLLLKQLQDQHKFDFVLASGSNSGKNIIPRLAAKLDVQPLAEVMEVKSRDTFVRPAYAGNAIVTVQSSDSVKLMTVRSTSFEKAPLGSSEAPVEKVTAATNAGLSKWLSDEVKQSERPELTSARVVVSGGRALKSSENFKMLEELADHLGGAVGASRAAVDAGYVSNDYQVGQTGKVVAPELYIAVGISGAIQHLAGMKDSKVIVAINKDAEAPIFQVADYGLVADLFKAVPEFTDLAKKNKK